MGRESAKASYIEVSEDRESESAEESSARISKEGESGSEKEGTYTVYILKFERKYYHTQFYIGITSLAVEDRYKRHKHHSDNALVRAVVRAGIPITYHVHSVWNTMAEARAEEIRLKKQKNTSRLYLQLMKSLETANARS